MFFALKAILPISIVVLFVSIFLEHIILLNIIHSVWLYFRYVSHINCIFKNFQMTFIKEKFTYNEMHRSFFFFLLLLRNKHCLYLYNMMF